MFSGWAVAFLVQVALGLSQSADVINRWVDGFSVACLLVGAAGLTWQALRRVRRVPGVTGVVICLALLLAAPGFGAERRRGRP